MVTSADPRIGSSITSPGNAITGVQQAKHADTAASCRERASCLRASAGRCGPHLDRRTPTRKVKPITGGAEPGASPHPIGDRNGSVVGSSAATHQSAHRRPLERRSLKAVCDNPVVDCATPSSHAEWRHCTAQVSRVCCSARKGSHSARAGECDDTTLRCGVEPQNESQFKVDCHQPQGDKRGKKSRPEASGWLGRVLRSRTNERRQAMVQRFSTKAGAPAE